MSHLIVTQIREHLNANKDPKTQASFKRFFKEDVKFYGTKTATNKEAIKNAYDQMKTLDIEEIFQICEELFASNMCEECWIAAELIARFSDQYKTEHFEIFDKWVNDYVTNWASCDTLCNHAVASFIDKYPEYIAELKKWSRSENRWVKRASAVTLIIPAREGRYLKDVFEIADTLLLDKDDMVQKGYGWMLKATSESHQKEVFDYVVKHKANMPRTALRYAIEKMPKEMKTEAMKK